jgi:hypothetical protein
MAASPDIWISGPFGTMRRDIPTTLSKCGRDLSAKYILDEIVISTIRRMQLQTAH